MVGFWPVRPPVQLYVYGAVPPEGETEIDPLFKPQEVFVALPLSVTAVEGFRVVVAVAVHEGVPESETVTV